eukprot:m.52836 g.52836  ORF g.52836 m.52836 type:complete len:405 (+) comp10822_c0_seq1:158-1372(+)
MRAVDAQQKSSVIGSNIGAGPDVCAEILAGERGFEILDFMMSGSPPANENELNDRRKREAFFLVDRTLYFDKEIMEAARKGIKQFVILAAGLDARAWRLPLDNSHTIYEVDCESGLKYKSEKISGLKVDLKCNRVTVAADLSQALWTSLLIKAGFSVDEPAFFLAEGLLMYLPRNAVPKLMQGIVSVSAPGSIHCGDLLINTGIKHNPLQKKLAKLGTKWTYDATNMDEFENVMRSAGFKESNIEMGSQMGAVERDEAEKRQNNGKLSYAGDPKLKHKAHVLIGAIRSWRTWPGPAQDWILQHLVKGAEGVKELLTTIAEDRQNTWGMQTFSKAEQDEVVRLLLEVIDNGGLTQELLSQKSYLAEARGNVGFFTKMCQIYSMMKQMRELKKNGKSGYFVYKCNV